MFIHIKTKQLKKSMGQDDQPSVILYNFNTAAKLYVQDKRNQIVHYQYIFIIHNTIVLITTKTTANNNQ